MLGIPMEDPVPGLQYYSPEMEANAEGYAQYVAEVYEKAKETESAPANKTESKADDAPSNE